MEKSENSSRYERHVYSSIVSKSIQKIELYICLFYSV